MNNKSIKISVGGVTKDYSLEALGSAGVGVQAGDIAEAVYDYLEKNPVEELADNEKKLMLSLFEHALYDADVSQIITALKNAWGNESDGDDTDEPIVSVYIITNNLTNVTNSNTAVSAEANTAYTATLTANVGDLHLVTVTMGGVDVTADVYADGAITIPAVTGNIVITASATQYSNLLDGAVWKKGTKDDFEAGLSYNTQTDSDITLPAGTYYFYELYKTAAGGVPGFYVANGDGTYTAWVNGTDFAATDNNGVFADGTYNEYGKENKTTYQPNDAGYLVEATVTLPQDFTGRIVMISAALTLTEPGYSWCFTQPYNPHKDTLGWEV